MQALLHFFRPAPHIPKIQEKEKIDTLYPYWRVRILATSFVGYALYYFTRKSFTFAMPGMIDEFGFDKGEIGLLGSILSIAYGISKFASGVVSDRANPRYFMAIGLMLTGICNLLFGFSSSLLMFALFWGLNGWFQGFGWPPCAKFLTHWYSQNERGRWWSTWNLSHNVGAFLIPWIVGFILQLSGWRMAMAFPGVICILGGFFLMWGLRDSPQSLGLPPIEEWRDDYGAISKKELKEKAPPFKEVLVHYILKNKYIWLLACAYFFVYIVRTAVNDWSALFLIEERGYSRLGANGFVSLFEIGGLAGSLLAGWCSDSLFQARRGPVNALFTIAIFFGVIAFWLTPAGHPLFDSFWMLFLGAAIFGPQMLIGIAAAELSHKKAAATSTGFVGCFAYLGAATAGYPFGKITQTFGWKGCFIGMAICAFLAFLSLLPLWSISHSKELHPQRV